MNADSARTYNCARRMPYRSFLRRGQEDACKLDADFAETGRLKGPLHGVLIGLKDPCAFRPRFPVSIPLFSFPPFRAQYAVR